MTSRDKHLAEVFPRPPLIAFKRQQNIRQHIIRAKVQTQQRQQRKVKGMKKCNKSCTGYPYIKEGKSLQIKGVDWKINQTLNCKSYNVVYAVICKKESCRQVYIGETKRFLKSRLDDHRGYINHGVEATGQHFTQPGHSLSDISITAIEQVKRKDTLYRKEREEYFIRKFNTFHEGMNNKI